MTTHSEVNWESVSMQVTAGVPMSEILETHKITLNQLEYARKTGKMTGLRGKSTNDVDLILTKIQSMSSDDVLELSRQIGNSIHSWSQHFFQNGGSARARPVIKAALSLVDKPKMVANQYNVVDLKAAVLSSFCWTDVCRLLNVSVCSYNFNRIKQLCTDHSISIAHFTKTVHLRGKPEPWTIESLLVQNCTITRSSLRPNLKRLGLYTGVCAECGITDSWNGKPLTIEIDHINGIHTDNRIENLRWLCPNCHSQTDTYRRGSNKES